MAVKRARIPMTTMSSTRVKPLVKFFRKISTRGPCHWKRLGESVIYTPGRLPRGSRKARLGSEGGSHAKNRMDGGLSDLWRGPGGRPRNPRRTSAGCQRRQGDARQVVTARRVGRHCGAGQKGAAQ